MKFIKYNKKNGGYSMVELIFYVALFSFMSLVVINSILTMTKSFKETGTYAEVMKGGDIIERISREVRRATSVASISASDLKINTKNDSGVAKTMEFVLNNGNVQLFENDVFTGNLNTDNVTISTLTFSQITTTNGVAIKIALDINSKSKTNSSESFYNTIVLRGDY